MKVFLLYYINSLNIIFKFRFFLLDLRIEEIYGMDEIVHGECPSASQLCKKLRPVRIVDPFTAKHLLEGLDIPQR